MRHSFDLLALTAAVLPAIGLAQSAEPVVTTLPTPPTTLEEPILRFEVIDVPAEGTVVSVAGRIERWTRRGWTDVVGGEKIEDGARIQIPANSDLVIRFAAKKDLRFSAVPTVRRVAFRVFALR